MNTTERVYRYIYSYAMSHGGNTPTLVEIGNAIEKSKSVVHHHVQKLIAMDRLARTDKKLIVQTLADMLQIIGDDDGPDWDS